MKTNRRGFFGAVVAAAASVATAAHKPEPPKEPSPQARELAELGEAYERLRTQMEKPITVHMEIDGRTLAKAMIREADRAFVDGYGTRTPRGLLQ